MLGENTIVKSQRVSGLRVRGYNSSFHVDLPPSYSKEHIPVNRNHIPTHETAKQWSHLEGIVNKMPPLLDCDIGLLIGYNCPRTLAPREVLSGKDNKPYAILTGWSIVGGSTPCMDETESSLCYRVNVKELPPVTPMDIISILESDFKDTKGDDKTVSQEDLIFLDKLKGSIRKNDTGHYEMPLPFKQRPHLPDNKKLAEIRLSHLRRKFIKDEKYKRDYTTYMKSNKHQKHQLKSGPSFGGSATLDFTQVLFSVQNMDMHVFFVSLFNFFGGYFILLPILYFHKFSCLPHFDYLLL